MTSANPQALQRGTSADVIARHIRNDIEAGRLSHQEQLPPSSQLAAEWGTSTATISRAMNQLAESGCVINRHGAGRIVNYPESSSQGEQRRPQVILIGGYRGSGNEELGRIMAHHTASAIIDKHTTP